VDLASVAPSCITMTIGRCRSPDLSGNDRKKWFRFYSRFFSVPPPGMHGVAFGGTGFVNDTFEKTANGGVVSGPEIVALGRSPRTSFSRSAE